MAINNITLSGFISFYKKEDKYISFSLSQSKKNKDGSFEYNNFAIKCFDKYLIAKLKSINTLDKQKVTVNGKLDQYKTEKGVYYTILANQIEYNNIQNNNNVQDFNSKDFVIEEEEEKIDDIPF